MVQIINIVVFVLFITSMSLSIFSIYVMYNNLTEECKFTLKGLSFFNRFFCFLSTFETNANSLNIKGLKYKNVFHFSSTVLFFSSVYLAVIGN